MTVFVCLFLINAQLTTVLDTAALASRDMTSKTANACSLTPTTPNPLIPDAEPGTGTTKNASPAQTDGSSTLKKFVLQFLTNAKLTLRTETAPLATTDTT
jgi:hypothetical protein